VRLMNPSFNAFTASISNAWKRMTQPSVSFTHRIPSAGAGFGCRIVEVHMTPETHQELPMTADLDPHRSPTPLRAATSPPVAACSDRPRPGWPGGRGFSGSSTVRQLGPDLARRLRFGCGNEFVSGRTRTMRGRMNDVQVVRTAVRAWGANDGSGGAVGRGRGIGGSGKPTPVGRPGAALPGLA